MNKAQQIFIHFFVWLAILSFLVFLSKAELIESIIIFVCFGIVNITLFYFNYLFLLPQYLSKRRYWGFIFNILIILVLSTFIKYGLAYLFKETILLRAGQQITFSRYFLGAFLTGVFFAFLSTAFKFSVDWFLNEKVRKNLENEKLIAELAFLKSQINPHFLFNSLNNIYSLTYQKSDKASEAVMKLSEIMRYMLQESNEPTVKLSREIRYLENYIELQKLRFKSKAYIDFIITGDIAEQSIAPLILIAFVENAFKHGDVSDASSPIRIRIEIANNILQFELWNKKSGQNKDETSGIGLNNVRRRLELLYTQRYTLSINEQQLTYYCKLSLDL